MHALDAAFGRRDPDDAAPVLIRPCRGEDLGRLEWSGAYAHHREIFHEAYALQQSGDVLMLLAEAGQAVIGQAWLDLRPKEQGGRALVWAVRVRPNRQRRGVGRALMAELEQAAGRLGCAELELGVEKDNRPARSFYERLGWRVAGERRETYRYLLPNGRKAAHWLDQWLMVKALDQPSNGRPTRA